MCVWVFFFFFQLQLCSSSLWSASVTFRYIYFVEYSLLCITSSNHNYTHFNNVMYSLENTVQRI